MLSQAQGMRMASSIFHNNTAGDHAGGCALVAPADSTGITISQSIFDSNKAGMHAGLKVDGHHGVHLVDSAFQGNNATSSSGGGFSVLASDVITLINCSIHHNVAKDYAGGSLMSSVTDVMINDSHVSLNVAGTDGGGLHFADSAQVTIGSTVVNENIAGLSGGGAYFNAVEDVDISIHDVVYVPETSLAEICSAETVVTVGDLFRSDSSCRNVTSFWEGNQAKQRGGALLLTGCSNIVINGSIFRGNVVHEGDGSAIYVRGTQLAMSWNAFTGNEASSAGTLFWEHASGMEEPVGLQSGENFFDVSNIATYGHNFATEAHHVRLLEDQEEYYVSDYHSFAPPVSVRLEDIYNQVLITDSSTLVTTVVPPSEDDSCDGGPGFLSGTTTVSFQNGTATFKALQPLCAANHSLILAVTALLSTVSSDAVFEYNFRACTRGEYYEERICSSCENGTYSFTDPHGLALFEISKSKVCLPCPSEAFSCFKDSMLLKQGYWRSDDDSTNIIECPWDSEGCQGGHNSGSASCGGGYRGPLCAVCEDEHHFVSSSQTCQPCHDTASFFDPYTITLIVLVCLCVFVTVYFVKKLVHKEAVTTLDGFLAVILLRLNVYRPHMYAEEISKSFQYTREMRQRVAMSSIVYITFCQILCSMPFVLADVDFPNVYSKLISALSVVNLTVNQEAIVSCSSSAKYDFVTELVVGTTFPLVLVLLLWLGGRVHIGLMYGVDDNNMSDERVSDKKKTSSKYGVAMLALSFLILPSGMI